MTAETTKPKRKPKLTDREKEALAYVRAHPGCVTSDVVMKLQLKTDLTVPILSRLVERNLIGRQLPPALTHDLESHWYPENKHD